MTLMTMAVSTLAATTSAVRIDPISAFNDNYIWCINDNNACWLVDPGCADSALNYIKKHSLTLCGILITHHHQDHTGGIEALSALFPSIEVYGPNGSSIAGITRGVANSDKVKLAPFDIELNVLTLPGHTLDHIGFVNDRWLFCGDTLFSGGCGRLFEGTAKQLYDSLQTLANLPETTKVYCTHEYTCANLRFAMMVEPENQALQQYQQWCQLQRQQQLPTLPSSIATERAVNPFLRCDQTDVVNSVERNAQESFSDNVSRFAALRRWKDTA